LTPEGLLLCTVGPRGLSDKSGEIFREKLSDAGFYVNCYVELPSQAYEPLTSLQILLVGISRTETGLNIYSLKEEESEKLASRLTTLFGNPAELKANALTTQFLGLRRIERASK